MLNCRPFPKVYASGFKTERERTLIELRLEISFKVVHIGITVAEALHDECSAPSTVSRGIFRKIDCPQGSY